VSVDVPAAWETIAVGHDHDAVAALEPDDGGRFCTSFVLAVGPDDEPAGEGPAGEGQAGEGAAEHVLLDHEDVRVGGHPGTRRLTTHATPAHESVTTESWSSVVDGLRVTLTANVATVRLNELSRLVDAVAASLVVAAPGSGPA
jgi:hypothetical protein